MKSIRIKIIGFLGMLCMLLVGTNVSAQLVEGRPTDEKIAALLSTSDAQVLRAHLTRIGYTATGLNAEGTVTLSSPQDESIPFNTLATTDYRNSVGNVVNLYTHSEVINGVETLVTRAEDDKIEYRVSAGKVITITKSINIGGTVITVTKSPTIDLTKLWNCITKYAKGCANMQPCFDCIKNCFQNNNKIWKKLKCSLGCSSCYNCVLSIAKIVWCYFS